MLQWLTALDDTPLPSLTDLSAGSAAERADRWRNAPQLQSRLCFLLQAVPFSESAAPHGHTAALEPVERHTHHELVRPCTRWVSYKQLMQLAGSYGRTGWRQRSRARR